MITYLLTAKGFEGRWYDILNATTGQPTPALRAGASVTYTDLAQAVDEAQQTADCLQLPVKIVKITRSSLGTYDPQEQPKL
jgi:hypothetical protein